MAMQFTIEYGDPGNPTEIDCQADGYTLLDGYYPDTASSPDQPVTDNARVQIEAATPAALSAKIQALNLAFQHARDHQTGPLGCYLNFAPDGTLDPWRTRIGNGVTLLDSGLSRRWKQNKAVVSLAIQRAGWWEGPEAQAPLTNGNGTNNTTGLTVTNHDDAGAGHDNFVSINAADVDGDLPGATRLQLLNNYATNRLYDVWIGHNWTDPANLAHILEGEAATGGSSGADATASGGQYRYISLGSGADTTLYTWTLAAAFLNACQGQFYKILARFWDGNVIFLNHIHQIRFKLQIIYQATTLWETGWTTIDPNRTILIRDLATLRIPPWLPNQTGLNAVELQLMARHETGSTYTAGLDFLQVTPVAGWRYLTCAGYGIEQNQRIMDDGINSDVYVDNGAGANKLGFVIPHGSPVMLKPGTLQRLYFLMHSHLGNTAEIARTMSVKLFYRPRRQNL
jgi:hypothetical protein